MAEQLQAVNPQAKLKRIKNARGNWPGFSMRCPVCLRRVRLISSGVTGYRPEPWYLFRHCDNLHSFNYEDLCKAAPE